MRKVLGIGNALVDIITLLTTDKLLQHFDLPKGSMHLVDSKKANQIENDCSGLSKNMASGGSAANTIHGLAKLGISTGFIGTVGDDEMGRFFFDDMKDAGIKPILFTGKQPTGRAISLVSPDSERTFATYLGAAIEMSENNLNYEVFSLYNAIHLEGYLVQMPEFMEKAFTKAKRYNMLISLDLSSFNIVASNIGFFNRMIEQYVDIVFANEEEAKAFTGMNYPPDALEKISKKAKYAVVKTGEKGSLIRQGNLVYEIPATKVRPMDTTGAGDLYASGFLYGLINGLSLDTCGNIGALLAGHVIEGLGAKIPESRWTQIRQRLNDMV
jgi:sugar/nucleoside kinase (ribokinase family)